MHNSPLQISLLMTGSELMSGDTIDSNSAFIAKALLEVGLEVQKKTTVGDNLALLIHEISTLSQNADILIINGGLGPTQDDLTALAISQACHLPISTHQEAKVHIEQWCLARRMKSNAANLKQAELPLGAMIFPDAPGSAPAFYCVYKGCLIIATPGVPSELKHITHCNILPFIQNQFAIKASEPWKKIGLIGMGESRLQEQINNDFSAINRTIDIGFRADFPTLEFKYRAKAPFTGNNPEFLKDEATLLNFLNPYIFSMQQQSIAEATIKILYSNNKTLGTAESCTGGLIASMLSQVSGASDVFMGSIVSYSNEVKTELLHVANHQLITQGAVSEATAQSMLTGLLSQIKSDLGIAVTGIAGPSGGSEEKPVGTVWIAWGSKELNNCVGLHIPFPRQSFQSLVSAIALDLIRRFTLNECDAPEYLQRWKLKAYV